MELLVRGFEVVIGFETHVQLKTQSKIFSRSSTRFGAEPNQQACPVDLALPGTLPVANRSAVACAIRFGLAVGAQIARYSVFARKHYFYPDLPKGYQISQFECPVVQGGEITFPLKNEAGAGALTGRGLTGDEFPFQTVRLVRAHLEEDAGKSVHEGLVGKTGLDFNRAGTPLLEVVTEPDLRSSQAAVAYAKELHRLVTWLGICDGNMQEGSFRCDANVSVRRPGAALGTRREIKNLNSFKFLQQAIDFEVHWQIDQIEEGRAIEQATVLFDPASGQTRSMRTKEDAADYRYFPDPDLPPLSVDEAWLNEIRAEMPVLPRALAQQLIEQHGLSPYDADQVTQSRAWADYFLATVAQGASPKLVVNWLMGEIAKRLNAQNLSVDHVPIKPNQLAALLGRVQEGVLSHPGAKQVLDALWADPTMVSMVSIDAFIQANDLRQVNDQGALNAILDQVIAANPDQVTQIRAGKDKALNALVGQVMKASQGKANPQQVAQGLRQKLGL
jgi:aspartyl-tRNA(Asn)/glutamyl-tRNA(Gln) amidotransferase subunit B